MKAQFLIAIAENDDMREPDSKNVLQGRVREGEATAEIEVYPAAHGWCPPDTQVYNKDAGREGVEPHARHVQEISRVIRLFV